jgi:glycosyltransferase involved in cell wall biosynthesis
VQFYAAADVYVGPSLYDSFAQPPLEAMACGLPVITSSRNGGSETIADGIDGLVMRDAEDPAELAGLVLGLHQDPDACRRMGQMAAEKARAFTWEDNAAQMRQLFEHAQRRKERRLISLLRGSRVDA